MASVEMPVETQIALSELVRKTLEKNHIPFGRYEAMARDFARKYWFAVVRNMDWYKEDLIDAFEAYGLPRQVLQEIAKSIEKRYGKEEGG
jgi:hypothetical protein